MTKLKMSDLEEFLETMKSRDAIAGGCKAKSGAERRQYKRVKGDFDVAFSTHGQTAVLRAVDISIGGVSIEAEVMAPVGERAYMTMCLPGFDSFSAPKAIGQIVWARRRVNGALGLYGVSFFAVQPEVKRMITDYIYNNKDNEVAWL